MNYTFHDWVCSFNEFPSPIGENHNEVANDPDFPKTDDWFKIKSYLESRNCYVTDFFNIQNAFIFYLLKNNKAYMRGNQLIAKNDCLINF